MSNEATEFMQKMDDLIASREITYKELERKMGLANGFFGKVRKRNALPTISKIDAIAKYFNVTRDYFIATETQTGTGVKIPLLGRVAAGVPIEAAENLIGYEEISGKLAQTGEFFALLIKGESMSPYICNGDKVIVRQQEEVENGEIAIVLINGCDATCKEFRKTSSGIMLISKNPSFEPMIFTSDEVESKPIRIIGKVVEIRREL